MMTTTITLRFVDEPMLTGTASRSASGDSGEVAVAGKANRERNLDD